ncbi:MAG: copper resistance protein NlpE N-terminal domain-containing protein [Fibrobacter sp.]|jgi:hypothetical protein|nr:copper resistance protein NlpE N-terminal domain-containing protein [Fibrobacter sp.]
MKRIVLAALCLGLFFACSKEESAPLPELPKVEIPEGLVGLYSGRLPCENCKMRGVRMELAEDSSLLFVQTLVTDTAKVDSLKGKYSFSDGKVSVVLDDGLHLNFVVDKYGALSMLTGAGTVYEDENGMKADLIKIFNVPKKKEGVQQ